jgi:hypothetical protein
VCVGGQNDMGIDGLGILLNGLLISTIEDPLCQDSCRITAGVIAPG